MPNVQHCKTSAVVADRTCLRRPSSTSRRTDSESAKICAPCSSCGIVLTSATLPNIRVLPSRRALSSSSLASSTPAAVIPTSASFSCQLSSPRSRNWSRSSVVQSFSGTALRTRCGVLYSKSDHFLAKPVSLLLPAARISSQVAIQSERIDRPDAVRPRSERKWRVGRLLSK